MHEFTGSEEYMAPEIINPYKREKSGYNEKVDVWAIGVCAWILLTGNFNKPETINAVTRSTISENAKDFLI
jgi:serine/threonine protein kinase